VSPIPGVDPAVWIIAGAPAALAVLAIGLAWVSMGRAKSLARAAGVSAQASQEKFEAAIQELQSRVDGLAAQLDEVKRQPPPPQAPAAPPPKPGMNLTKRSHAIRLHRRGDTPAQIAAALDLPVQEVDLLLKVHQIVISNI
jgi:hypothetical protein